MKYIFSLLIALVLSVDVSAASLNKIVVFGDSLSDNGNFYEYMKHQLPLSPPYFQGRFTNGWVWVELLAKSYYPKDWRSHLLDYAFGGAGVLGEEGDFDDDTLFTLNREIDSYLIAHQNKADKDSVYIMWMGANNYLSIPDDMDEAVKDVNWGIKTSLERLIKHGARYFLVINLPDLGKTPAAQEFDAVESLSYCALLHNSTLQKTVEQLQADYPEAKLMLYDVNQMFENVLANPSSYGFTNMSDTCYEAMLDPSENKSVIKMISTVRSRNLKGDACDGYFFFDPVHPAKLAHQWMAKEMRLLFEDNHVELE